MLISAEYRALNQKLHEENEHFGSHSDKWADKVDSFAKNFHIQSILDVGCGKGTLGQAIGSKYDWRDYDPAIPGKDKLPAYADMVVCTDVIEHIEPEFLENFLTFIQSRALKVIFLTVATRPAQKMLEDGRNAHLTIKPIEWWLPKMNERFKMLRVEGTPSEFEYWGACKTGIP